MLILRTITLLAAGQNANPCPVKAACSSKQPVRQALTLFRKKYFQPSVFILPQSYNIFAVKRMLKSIIILFTPYILINTLSADRNHRLSRVQRQRTKSPSLSMFIPSMYEQQAFSKGIISDMRSMSACESFTDSAASELST